MKLILVRHGETEWNAERRLQGHADAPLSARGLQQARGASLFFAGSPAPVHVVSSDLTRARRTAEILGFPDAATDARLREMDLGEWTGRWIDDIEKADAKAYRNWRLGTHTPPGGESWGRFCARVDSALTEISRRHGGDVVVVTHEGVVRAACQILIGLTPECMAPVSPAALTILTVDHAAQGRTARLVAYNFAPTPGDLRTRGLDHVAV